MNFEQLKNKLEEIGKDINEEANNEYYDSNIAFLEGMIIERIEGVDADDDYTTYILNTYYLNLDDGFIAKLTLIHVKYMGSLDFVEAELELVTAVKKLIPEHTVTEYSRSLCYDDVIRFSA